MPMINIVIFIYLLKKTQDKYIYNIFYFDFRRSAYYIFKGEDPFKNSLLFYKIQQTLRINNYKH
jgi:hypothetical protein